MKKKIDLFVDRNMDPEGLEKLGLDTRLNMKCHLSLHELVLKDRVKTIRIRSMERKKIYSIWFKDGGTAELDVSDDGELQMVDTVGCDFWIGWGRIEFYSHKPDGRSERMRWGDSDYEGPVNSSELMLDAIKNGPSEPVPDNDPEDGGTLH
jgi:hypothetical protein